MDFTTIQDALQKLIYFRPTQTQLANILGVRSSAIGNRIARGSKLKDDEIHKIEAHYGVKLPIPGADINTIEVDYYKDVNASCGIGSLVLSEEVERIKIAKSNIKDYAEDKKYSVINAFGVSMQPYIQDLDKLIVEHCQGQPIIDNRIYAFRYNDELYVKRLAKNIDEVIISSDNPAFENKIVKFDDNLKIVGRIVGLIRNM